ncbi:MAG: response regulator transcription factor [Bacteroidales bacterium]|nr:response regulator transcription factor [Bacteroidales bacterium]
MKPAKILVVDDEDTLCEVLRFNLEVTGYDVDVAQSAEEALTKISQTPYNLIILDVMMGETSGFTLARKLKADKDTKDIPIIFLTAKDSEDDMIAGLNIGADDYIFKPYTIRNIVARVGTVLRRTMPVEEEPEEDKNVIHVGELSIDTTSRSVYINGNYIRMPRKEYEILKLFVSTPGRVYTREEILSKIWGDDVVVIPRVVDVNVTRLRKKLGDFGDRIMTRSGYGYGFEL